MSETSLPAAPVPDIRRLVVPTPFPVGPANCYVLLGSPLVLVDTGPSTPSAREALERGLAGLGLGFPDIEAIWLTHPHIDHYGLADEVARLSGAPVVAHAEAVPRLAGKLHQGKAGEKEALEGLLVQAGAPEAFGRDLLRQWASADTLAATVKADKTLEDGDLVTGGGVAWRAISTPGHSPGSLCYYDPGSRCLLSGDHLLPHISSNAIMEFTEAGPGAGSAPRLVRVRSLEIYIRALRKIEALDVREVFPGHGEPFTGHRELIARRMRHYERRKDAIAKVLRDKGPSTAFGLARTLFPKQDQIIGQFLALSEVLGHLDLLETDGRVECRHGEGDRRIDTFSDRRS